MEFDEAFTVLTTPAPTLSGSRATRVLEQHYGISGTLKALVSERDQNFIVTDAGGRKYLLKVSNAEEDPQITDFQSRALLHVGSRDPEFPVPRIIRTCDNRIQATVTGESGRDHTVRLLSWLNGIPLGSARERPDIAARMGAVLARLDLALEDFRHPRSDYALLWDLKRAMKLVALLPNIQDGELQELCRRQLAVFEATIEPSLPSLRHQVIYNDLNPSNLLVDPDNPATITGVIDFGDMVRSPLIADVAVGAAYLCDGESGSLENVERFVAGYHRMAPLRNHEIEALFDLIMTRHVMTIAITHWRAAQYPANRDYILRNEPRARRTVERLNDLSRSAVTSSLRAACMNSREEAT